MDANHLHKLDPRLRRHLGLRVAAKKKNKRETEQVFVEVANAEAAKCVKNHRGVSKLVQVVDGYYTAIVAAKHLAELAAIEGVIEIEAVRLLRRHLDHSLTSIRGNEETAAGGGVPDGRGVVIGFVDYGLDFTQKDFQNPRDRKVKDAHNPRGKTRIAYLWDQQLKPRKKLQEHAPLKYGYGVEYSSKQIDHALRTKQFELIRHDPLSAGDQAGHGTHVAGIAAGNGETADAENPPGKYVGVAPAATIVFVSLDRDEIVNELADSRGTLANSANIAHGIAYCFEKADELGMPCVVNLSLGANGGGHDGNMVLECIIDTLLQKSGRAVVMAAGNEDGARLPVHATGRLAQEEEAALEWKVGRKNENDPNANEIEVWYPRGSEIKVWLVAPDKETSDAVLPGDSATFRFTGGERVSINSDRATPWNGAARIHIELGGTKKNGIRFGTWIVKLQAIRVAPGGLHLRRYADWGRVRFDAWIERTPLAKSIEENSRFAHYDPDTAINVTTPSTARRAIVVASYDNDPSRDPSISGFSSRGPTRDGRQKPELSAPGNEILSTNARAGLSENGIARPARIGMSGTSMAAPHVAGVVARMLGVNAYLTVKEISELLIESATPPAGGMRKQWNSKWGFGKLNAARAVELVKHRSAQDGQPAERDSGRSQRNQPD